MTSLDGVIVKPEISIDDGLIFYEDLNSENFESIQYISRIRGLGDNPREALNNISVTLEADPLNSPSRNYNFTDYEIKCITDIDEVIANLNLLDGKIENTGLKVDHWQTDTRDYSNESITDVINRLDRKEIPIYGDITCCTEDELTDYRVGYLENDENVHFGVEDVRNDESYELEDFLSSFSNEKIEK